MHKNRWQSSEFLIELPQIEYNPGDFLDFIDNYEFDNYTSAYGTATPLDVCYDPMLLEEPIVQHYLNVFKDFDIRMDYNPHDNGTGLNGFCLSRSNMKEQGLARHIDASRPTCITFPLTFPQSINFYESKESDILDVYEYTPTIIILNSGSKWHSVSKSSEPRLQFQFDCYNSWDEVHELINTLNKV